MTIKVIYNFGHLPDSSIVDFATFMGYAVLHVGVRPALYLMLNGYDKSLLLLIVENTLIFEHYKRLLLFSSASHTIGLLCAEAS
ncbi:hypothetical protein L596_026727 [Steinernema carpocapsae]|uniref:Uncharacterized protein n=1 Tax=Steinernema carpocapsae TaxID=34508 RepID=A0A4U5M361_STECR|nr:hypothetical protein L596_026727 [Steinernema carpocapsae]